MRAGALESRRIEWRSVLERAQGFTVLLASSFAAHSIFFLLLLFYFIGFCYVREAANVTADLGPMGLFQSFVGYIVPTTLIGVVVQRFLYMAYYVRPKHPTLYLIKDVSRFLTTPRRLLNAIPVMLVLTIFVIFFSIIKDAIPFVQPFSWDVTFMELDRTLHFGVDPWRLLQPVLGYWPITFLLNIIYNLWFAALWIVWVWMAFAEKQSELRLQYLISYFLSWSIGGSFLAIAFSSAGPVYYSSVVSGPDPYAPLMSYLRETNQFITLWAVQTQQALWEAFLNNNNDVVSGISAMPSMHNTVSMLMALLGWRINRVAGIAGTLFAVTIFLGSVHLGWHYAVDAYLGFAIAIVSWWGAGRLARWYMTLSFVRRHTETLEKMH